MRLRFKQWFIEMLKRVRYVMNRGHCCYCRPYEHEQRKPRTTLIPTKDGSFCARCFRVWHRWPI